MPVKPLPIILIVVVLAAAGIGGYFMMQSDDDNSTTNTTANTNRSTATDDDEGNGLFSGSAADLIARGDDLTCTYTFTSDDATSSGTTYFSDGRMRGDFDTQVAEQSVTASSMIQDETYFYMWTEGATSGTKMKIDELDDTTTATNSSTPTDTNTDTESVDTEVLDTDYEYDCDDWRVDESKFTPPSDVTFQDLSALTEQMQALTNGSTDLTNSSSLLCATCDYLTGDEQTDCRAQYDCE